MFNAQLDYLENTVVPARRGGAEVAGWTLDRKIRVRFPAYPHRVWALWWQGGKRRLRTCGCPAAGQNLETGHLSRHYIAEISLNVTLKPQSTSINCGSHTPCNLPLCLYNVSVTSCPCLLKLMTWLDGMLYCLTVLTKIFYGIPLHVKLIFSACSSTESWSQNGKLTIISSTV